MKTKSTAYLLLFTVGFLGAHKFYLGNYVMGLIYLVTFGFFGFGLILDLFTLSRSVDFYNLLQKPTTAIHNNVQVNLK